MAAWTGALADRRAELEALKRDVAPVFGRGEPRQAAGAFIDGVLSSAERRTGRMLAEQAGMGRPHRIPSCLGRNSWSADALCGHIRDYVAQALGDPAGVLVIDETGFLKKGRHSGGVARGRQAGWRTAMWACPPLDGS